MVRRGKSDSAIVFLLKGLLPYSKENLKLSTKPNQFFNDLEKRSGYNRKTLRNAAWRAEKRGLINKTGSLFEITEAGKQIVEPFKPNKLPRNVMLMVAFDVPEELANNRRKLRLTLKEWGFRQAQKSLWVSNLDYRKLLVEVVDELSLQSYVLIYESARIYPKK